MRAFQMDEFILARLGRLKGFTAGPAGLPWADRQDGLVGWYRNPAPREGVLVLFTPDAMSVCDASGNTRVPFDEIDAVEGPRDKESADGVKVHCALGWVFIPFCGGHAAEDRSVDAFELWSLVRGILKAK